MLRNYLRKIIKSSLNLRNQYSIRFYYIGLAWFSSHKQLIESLQKEKDQERRTIVNAFIARMLISYIASCPAFSLPKEKSIRNSILDEALIKQYIKGEIRQANPSFSFVQVQNWIQSQDFHLSYYQVTSAFDVKRGSDIDLRVFIQNRMLQARTDISKIILNPLSFTKDYFQCLINGKNNFNYLLSGSKGIGKSFSFVTYGYLSGYIHHISFSQQETQRKLSKYLLYKKGLTFQPQALNISRIVYLSSGNKFDLGKYFSQLVPQFKGIYQQADILEQTKFTLGEKNEVTITKEQMELFLGRLKKKIGKEKICFLLVFDEANKIFSLIRRIYQKMIQQKKSEENPLQNTTYKKSPDYDQLNQYSEILQLFGGYFTNICFHSSQSHQVQIMKQFDDKDKQMYLFRVLLKSHRTWIFKNFQQSKLIKSKRGQIQLYKIFLFELQCLLSRQTQITLQKLRQIFLNTFNLNEDPQKKHTVLRWKNDVRFLDIRQYLKSSSSIYAQLLDMIDEYKQMRNENQCQNYLIRLKQQIEEYRFKQLGNEKIFQNYISKSVQPSQSLARHFILLDLFSEITLFKDRTKGSMEKEPDQFRYTNLKISKYQKEILCFTLNIGFVEQNSIIFPLSPSDLQTLLLNVAFTERYNAVIATIVENLWLSENFNVLFGKMLDNLSFSIFKRPTFQIRIYEVMKDSVENQLNKEFKQFKCDKSVAFRGIHNISAIANYQNHFKNLFQESRKYPGQYIAGYPIKKNKNFDTTSEFFDNIVLKMNHGNSFDMIVLDWTIGKVQGKIINNFQATIRPILQNLAFSQNIALTFYLVAPQYQVNYFLQNSKNKHLFTQPSRSIQVNGFTHSYCYRLASYDSNLPFSAGTLHPIKVSHDLMRQIYQRNKEILLNKNKNK